jgi:uncharacterized protein
LDFFAYSRDAADSAALRDDQELQEEHWSYMDRFADSMSARGPTLDPDRETATGSLHVLGLPGVDAAREFVAQEPNNRAGVYREHLVWRFENRLGRSMCDFSGHAKEPRFLIIGRSHRGRPLSAEALPAELFDRLILYGALTTLDGGKPAGVALGSSGAESRSCRCAHGGRADRAWRDLRGRDPQLGVWRPALKGTATRPTRTRRCVRTRRQNPSS